MFYSLWGDIVFQASSGRSFLFPAADGITTINKCSFNFFTFMLLKIHGDKMFFRLDLSYFMTFFAQ